MRESYLFMLIFMLFLSCSKSKDEPIPEKFRGNWILVNGEKDVELKINRKEVFILYQTNRDYKYNVDESKIYLNSFSDGSILKSVHFISKKTGTLRAVYTDESIDTLSFFSSAFDVFSPSDSLISLKFIKK
jgi:hypothetical protein